MKRFSAFALALLLALSLLAGCAGSSAPAASAGSSSAPAGPSSAPAGPSVPTEGEEPPLFRVAGLRGPTSMGMVRLMEQAESGQAANRYAFTVAGSADEIVPRLLKGEFDLAALPANLAAVLYNNSNGQLQLLALNTLGVLSIVETGQAVNSLQDLRGQTLYATGKGSTPEYALRYLLAQNGLDPDADLTIEWKSEPTEVVALLAQGQGAVAMLPQPYVTVAQAQVEGLRVAVDLNEAWQALDNGSLFITGVLVVRTGFAQQYPEELKAFLEEYRASTQWVNEHPDQAAPLVEKAGIVKAAVAEKAIPACNITCLTGAEMKQAAQGYLQVLFEQNPDAVGGALPGDGFYYGA